VTISAGALAVIAFTFGSCAISSTAGASAARIKIAEAPKVVKIPGALEGVAAISANDVWAVGSVAGMTSDKPFILHWNGSQWKLAHSSAFAVANLSAVAGVSRSDAWAVGTAGPGNANTLIEHWNGTRWVQVHGSALGHPGQLIAVTATSARNAWAVGTTAVTQTHPAEPLILHWNGSTWKRQTATVLPHPGGLSGVTATSARDAWAVGYSGNNFRNPLILHWDGTAWKRIPGPALPGRGSLAAVSAASSGDVWAVGGYGTSHNITLALHWNGTSWKRFPSPSESQHDSDFNAVGAASASDAWAVGTTIDTAFLVAHWNGAAWKRVRKRLPAASSGGALEDVAATSRKDAWAVGFIDYDTVLIEHWNGSSWTRS
jgi:hypothetical protein